MGWVSGARLTAATSSAGGLGILASVTMTLDQLAAAIDEVRARTDRPFGVNLRADQPDIDARIRMIVAKGVKLASFAQAPQRATIERLKEAGVVVMPTIAAKRHAEKVAGWGVDAVIAQGAEGGGHTGSVPISLLIPQVTDVVDIPVLAAGGIVDGRGWVSAIAAGAAGVAMGTRFLLTAESRVPDAVKGRYVAAGVNDTVVTTALDGFPQRVIRTEVVDKLEKASPITRLPKAIRQALAFRRLTNTPLLDMAKEGVAMKRNQDLTWAQVAMAANAPMLIKATMVDGKPEVGILPTGQGVGRIDDLPTVAELLDRMVVEAHGALARLGVPGAGA